MVHDLWLPVGACKVQRLAEPFDMPRPSLHFGGESSAKAADADALEILGPFPTLLYCFLPFIRKMVQKFQVTSLLQLPVRIQYTTTK